MHSHKNITPIPDILLKQINNKHQYASPIIPDILMTHIIPNTPLQPRAILRVACKFLLFSPLSNDKNILQEIQKHNDPMIRLEKICSAALSAFSTYRRSNKAGKTGEKRDSYYSEIIGAKNIQLKYKAIAIYALLTLEGGINLKTTINTAIAPLLTHNTSNIAIVAQELMKLMMTATNHHVTSEQITLLANELFKFKDTPPISKIINGIYRAQFLSDMAAIYSVSYHSEQLNKNILKMLDDVEQRQLNQSNLRAAI